MSRHQAISDEFELLRVPQVALALELSEKTVFRLLRAGKLPGGKIGRSWYVSKPALQAYIRSVTLERTNDVA